MLGVTGTSGSLLQSACLVCGTCCETVATPTPTLCNNDQVQAAMWHIHSWEMIFNASEVSLSAKLCMSYRGAVFVQEGQRAYYKLRLERTNAKLIGVRAKRAAEAAAEEAAKAK